MFWTETYSRRAYSDLTVCAVYVRMIYFKLGSLMRHGLLGPLMTRALANSLLLNIGWQEEKKTLPSNKSGLFFFSRNTRNNISFP